MCFCALLALCLTPSLGTVLLSLSLHAGLAPQIAAPEHLYMQACRIPTANTYWWFLQHSLKMCFLLSVSGATTLCKLFLSQHYCNLSLPLATTAACLESPCKGNCPSMRLSPCHSSSALPRWLLISLVPVPFVPCPVLRPPVSSHSVLRSFAQVPGFCPHCTCAVCALSHAWRKQPQPLHIGTS